VKSFGESMSLVGHHKSSSRNAGPVKKNTQDADSSALTLSGRGERTAEASACEQLLETRRPNYDWEKHTEFTSSDKWRN